MKNTLITTATGAGGIIASVGADSLAQIQQITENLPNSNNLSLYIQFTIGLMTFASLIIQTFFKKNKSE